MKMVTPEGSINLNRGKHSFSFHQEFKDWLKKHPKAMSKVASLIEKIISNVSQYTGQSLEEGDIKVVYTKRAYSDVFKVSVGEDNFFVKRDHLRSSIGGQKEYLSSVAFKENFKNDPDIEVIDFQLGYTNADPNHPITYFVSKWEDLETVAEYLKRSDLEPKDKKDIEDKVTKARGPSFNYYDIKAENMCYDPKTKKIKIFDINWDN